MNEESQRSLIDRISSLQNELKESKRVNQEMKIRQRELEEENAMLRRAQNLESDPTYQLFTEQKVLEETHHDTAQVHHDGMALHLADSKTKDVPQDTTVYFRSTCNGASLQPRILVPMVSPEILERLRWESGPGSLKPAEVSSITSILRDARKKLDDYAKEMLVLESRGMEQRRLQEYTLQLQSLLSPIRKIPDEILQLIFDHSCDMNYFFVGNIEPSENATSSLTRKPALTLSNVCCRWRRNGLSTPAIWSRISLRFGVNLGKGYSESTHDATLGLLSLYLDRSITYPLALHIRLDRYPQHTNGKLHCVVTCLTEQSHRWHSLTFRSEAYLLTTLFPYPEDDRESIGFPLLEELDNPRYHWDDTEQDLSTLINKAPRLTKLTLGFLPLNEIEGIPYTQLSHMEYFPAENQQTERLCYDSPNLVSLGIPDVYIKDRDMSEFPSRSHQTCHTVERLVVHHHIFDRALETPSVLPSFTFPSLKSVHLEPSYRYAGVANRGSWANFDHFMALLSRSSCLLTTLSIQSLALSDSDLIHLLTCVQTLLVLVLDDTDVPTVDSPITCHLIERLNSNTPDPLILPNLYSLTLNIGAPAFNDASVIGMAQSRWISTWKLSSTNKPVDCLRELTIRYRNREEVHGVYQSLENIEKDGMRAVVLWKPCVSESLSPPI